MAAADKPLRLATLSMPPYSVAVDLTSYDSLIQSVEPTCPDFHKPRLLMSDAGRYLSEPEVFDKWKLNVNPSFTYNPVTFNLLIMHRSMHAGSNIVEMEKQYEQAQLELKNCRGVSSEDVGGD